MLGASQISASSADSEGADPELRQEPTRARAASVISYLSSLPDDCELELQHQQASSRRASTETSRAKVAGDFVGGRRTQSEDNRNAGFHLRYLVADLRIHRFFEGLLGLIVCLDQAVTIIAIDSNATGQELPVWAGIASNVCLAFFTLEVCMAVYVLRFGVLQDSWVLLDIGFLVAAAVELFVDYVLEDQGAEWLRSLRILRILRLSKMQRTLRRFPMLKELRKMVHMTASCFRTMMWSFVFAFVMMTAWSMVAMEVVRPTVKHMEENGGFEECGSKCDGAMDTVMLTNLMFFSSVVAGDSWSAISRPVILEQPLTAFVFCGALMTLVFGVLNLIVAVLVDTFAEQREKDVNSQAEELEAAEQDAVRFFTNIFAAIDADASGELTLDELLAGASLHPEFQSHLRVMDIDEHDLSQLFHMLDSDHGGTIDPEEFIGALTRWVNESKTASRFVKFNVERTIDMLSTFRDEFGAFQSGFQTQMIAFAKEFKQLRSNVVPARDVSSSFSLASIIQSLDTTPHNGDLRSPAARFAFTHDVFKQELKTVLDETAAVMAIPRADLDVMKEASEKLSLTLQEVQALVRKTAGVPEAQQGSQSPQLSIKSPPLNGKSPRKFSKEVTFPKSKRIVSLAPKKRLSQSSQDAAILEHSLGDELNGKAGVPDNLSKSEEGEDEASLQDTMIRV